LITEEEEDPELQLFIQRQMEQEEIDRHDLKTFHEKQQRCSHSYIFVESLPPEEPEIYLEKWKCVYCHDERTLTIHVGVRDV
jgi:hypothetical protein